MQDHCNSFLVFVITKFLALALCPSRFVLGPDFMQLKFEASLEARTFTVLLYERKSTLEPARTLIHVVDRALI